MDICHYRDEIVRAVLGNDAVGAVVANSERLGQLATALAQAAEAKGILCAKKYGTPEFSIDSIVRLVPDAPKGK